MSKQVKKEEIQKASKRMIWFARFGSILFLGVLAILTVTTYLWASDPGFYYMEFVVLILFGPPLLALSLSYWLIVHLFRLPASVPESDFRPRRPVWIALFVVFASIFISLPFQGPLKLTFLTAKPTLEATVFKLQEDWDQSSSENLKAGFYFLRSAKTNSRKYEKDMLVFRFEKDAEQAFIHSPTGIENLNYNAGSKGHLMGHWYWMCED